MTDPHRQICLAAARAPDDVLTAEAVVRTLLADDVTDVLGLLVVGRVSQGVLAALRVRLVMQHLLLHVEDDVSDFA